MDSSWSQDGITETFTARERKFDQIRAALLEILGGASAVQDAFELDKLEVRNVEFINGEDGGEYYRAWIGGAAPDATKLNLYLLEGLNARGLPEVLISTEW